MTIGQKIKHLRTSRNLYQKDVALGVGVTDVMISKYESDKKKPGRDTIIKLANFFDVDANYFMEDEVKILTNRDRKDIAKTLDKVMGDLSDGENAPLFYGNEMSDTDKELLKSALQNALEILKIKNKVKYTPKKYRD